MQEIHSTGGGRLFGAGAGAGDRRLRPHHHHNSNNNQNQQALKCPRCDSLNTKFCYYNNYNLSQPRHFCKSCRRYWTKGGVLRNVPVGGGCRKSKRSKPKTSSSETSTGDAAAAATPPPAAPPAPSSQSKTSNSHSSSESSSLTAAAAAAAAASEALSAPSSNSASNNLLDSLQDSKFFVSNPSFEPGAMEQGDSGIFSEIGNITNLITSSTNEALAFGFGNIPDASSFQFSSQWQKGMNVNDLHQDMKFPEMTTTAGSLLDQTVPVDLSAVQNKIANGGFGPLDWQESTDRGLFDLPNTVDQSYWSHSQWNQDNHSLFHLP